MAKQPVSASAPFPAYGLPAHDPDALRYAQYIAPLYGNDPIAMGVAAMHIGSVAPDQRTAETIAERLNGPGHEAAIQALFAEGVRRAEPILTQADQHRQAAQEANDQLEHLIHARRTLPEQIAPIAGAHLTRHQVRTQLPIWQQVAENRALAGDTEHEKQPGRSWIGWVLAFIIAVIEAGITIRIFNVSITALSLSAVTWLGITAALVFFNHLVLNEAGSAQRDYRETRKQNRLIAEKAIGTTHARYYGGTR